MNVKRIDGEQIKLTCFRISNGARAAHRLPQRIKLLAWGNNPSVKGNIRLGDQSLKQFSAVQAEHGWDRVALDFEHNTVEGTKEYERSQEPRKVAAYGIPELLEDDGLYLTDLVYTPAGQDNAREYIDLSPAVVQDDDGEVIGMHSAALCRHGAVEDLTYYSIDATALQTNQENADMTKELEAKITALTADNTDLKAKVAGLVALTGTVGALEEQVKTLAAGIGEQITSLNAALEQRDRQTLLDQARREGKVVPLSAEDVAKMDIKALTSMVEKLPVTVPLEQRTPVKVIEHTATDAASLNALNMAEVRRIAHQLISDEGLSFPSAWNRAEAEVRARTK